MAASSSRIAKKGAARDQDALAAVVAAALDVHHAGPPIARDVVLAAVVRLETAAFRCMLPDGPVQDDREV